MTWHCTELQYLPLGSHLSLPTVQEHAPQMINEVDSSESQAIEDEIAELERKLQNAKISLNAGRSNGTLTPPPKVLGSDGTRRKTPHLKPF